MKEKEFLDHCYEALKKKGKYFDDFIKLSTRSEGWVESEIVRNLVKNRIEIKSVKAAYKNEDRTTIKLPNGKRINPDIILKESKILIEIKTLNLHPPWAKFRHYLNKSLKKDLKKICFAPNNLSIWLVIVIFPFKNVKALGDETDYKKMLGSFKTRKEKKINTPGGNTVKLLVLSKPIPSFKRKMKK